MRGHTLSRRSTGRGPLGAVAIVVCMGLMVATAVLAAAVQQSLGSREDALGQRWRRLQAQALAEGILHRTLVAFDDAQALDAGCQPTAAGVGAGAQTFADRMRHAGAMLSCQVELQPPDDRAGWRCTCTGGLPEDEAVSATGHGWVGWASLTVAAAPGAGPMLQLLAEACVRPRRDPAGCEMPASRGQGHWRESLLLDQTADGRWKPVVGSWEGF